MTQHVYCYAEYYEQSFFSFDRVYTGHFLQSVFSGGADRQKLITSFTKTNFVTSSFKATRVRDLKNCRH